MSFMVKHFVSLKDFSSAEIERLINLSVEIKKKSCRYKNVLKDKCIGLFFEKPSLRTKTAFYVGALQLGASALYYSPDEVKIGEREKIGDVARTVSGYLDAVVLRTFDHENVLEFAKYASIPVINGLSNLLHPTQVLADMMTIQELKGPVKNLKIVYLGDGNNVCNSLIYALSILGGNLSVATPKKYAPSSRVMAQVPALCRVSKGKISLTGSVEEAVASADVLYTDVWTSMGEEKERKERKRIFQKFQINDKILKLANDNCIVMHCLPAHRNEEITDSVIDGSRSVVFQQAQNRLYAAKAVLVCVLEENG